MMFEIKHLKTLATLADTGSIKKTADRLFSSQSALSHQIKDLEQRINASLFIRNTSPVQFTPQGEVLLKLANDILPQIDETLAGLKNKLKPNKNSRLTLTIAIACHACFQWLIPVTEVFSRQHSGVRIEFLEQVFSTQDHEESTANIDILFTDEKIEKDGFYYHKLGSFEVVAVLASHNTNEPSSLIRKSYLEADDFSKQVLLTYPVKAEKLDIFKLFLNKSSNKTNSIHAKKKQPITIKQVANSHMILQMVAANMGIATMPDWLVNSLAKQSLVQTKPIGKAGIYKTLYARYKLQTPNIEIIEQLIPKTAEAFTELYSEMPLNKPQ